MGTIATPVTFFQDDGYRIRGDLYTSGERQNCAVVFCHGWGGTKGIVAPVLAGEIVRRIDAAALVFDYSGWGESEGPRGRLDPWREVRDIRSAVTFMASEFPFLADRIGLYGFSFGGAISTYAAATDDRVRSLVAIAAFQDGDRFMRDIRPWWEYKRLKERIEHDRLARVRTGTSEQVDPDWILRRDPEAEAFNQDLRMKHPERNFLLDVATAELICSFDVGMVAPRLASRPSLFIHCAEDLLVPSSHSVKLAAMAGGDVRVLPGLGHYDIYDGPGLDAVSSLAAGHLARLAG